VAEITRHLDGLPLAIELAAARVKLLSPQKILERLEKRFDLLEGGGRDLPSRQRTLRQTIAWSFELLNKTEQNIFAKLAVFMGGFTLEAAEAVIGGSRSCVGDLASLVDKSLLQLSSETLRFTMLETIREYALEKLENSGNISKVRSKHASYFLSLAEPGQNNLTGDEQRAWLEQVEQEYDNMRAVFAFAKETNNLELVVRLGRGLLLSFWVNAHLSEGRAWLDFALKSRGSLSKDLLAKALLTAGALAIWLNDLETAATQLQESAKLFNDLGDKRNEAFTLLFLGDSTVVRGERDLGKLLLERGLKLAREVGDVQVELLLQRSLLPDVGQDGDDPEVEAQLQKGLARAWERGDRLSRFLFLVSLGWTTAYKHDLTRAAAYFAESLELCFELNYQEGIAYVLEGYALIALKQEQTERAATLLGAALALRDSINSPGWRTREADVKTLRQQVQESLGWRAYQKHVSEGRNLGREKVLSLIEAVKIYTEQR
jgi:hypothetical protein